MSMKNSFSLLELIATVFISSIVIIYSITFVKELHFLNFQKQQTEIEKLELLSTKLYLEKRKNIQNRLTYKNKNLYFDNNLLLENVTKFNLVNDSKNIRINLTLADKISQSWSFKVE